MLVVVAAAGGCTPGPAPTPGPRPEPGAEPAPEVGRPTARPPAEGFVDASGDEGRLWYRIVGEGRDTILIPLGSMLVDSLAPYAGSRTLVFYDPRARGQSDSLTDSTHATFANDVSDLEAARQALGISRAVVLGYDYFAAVAVAYASQFPSRVQGLVLLSPIEPQDSVARAYAPPERWARLDTTAARALVKARAFGQDTLDPTAYCREYWRVNGPVFVGDTVVASRLAPAWCDLPQETPAWLGRHLGLVFASLGEGWDFSAAARGVTVPALVVHGERDLVASPDGAAAWAALLPNARLAMVPDVGHLPFIETPRRLAAILDEFLRE